MMIGVQWNERMDLKRKDLKRIGAPIEGESWPIPAHPDPPKASEAPRRRRRSPERLPSWRRLLRLPPEG
jgi:hypothetical protein